MFYNYRPAPAGIGGNNNSDSVATLAMMPSGATIRDCFATLAIDT